MKTVDDILRKMREFADEQEKNDYYDLRALSTDSFRGYADLIEKAVKHQFRDTTKTIPEKVVVAKMETTTPTCEKSSQVGNTAAMREALEDARRFVSASAQRTDRDLLIMDEKRGAYVLTPKETLIKIDDALSTPPRNCDRFATAKEAGEAFISETCENPCGYCTVSDECHNPLVHECGIDWLFAEAKGETDGSK